MQININGMALTLVSTGRVSRGGKEIFELKGAKGTDGTEFYITAYRPIADAGERNARVSAQSTTDSANLQVNGAVRPKVRKANAQSPAAGPDINAIVQAVMAAMAAKQS